MSVDHYENFPVASWLCPPALRPAVAAIYRFARTADDLADEGEATTEERLNALARYEAMLHECAAGHVGNDWPEVFAPLAVQIRQHALPVPLLAALLDAFRQDTRNPLYEDRAALLDYCTRSANPIGRLLLHLVRVHDARSLAQSDAICTALQLINFWQDLSIDLPRGRCYVTRHDARRHALSLPPIASDSEASRAMVRELTGWSRSLMLEGAPLVHRLAGRFGWELRLVVQGGLRVLDKIEARHYDAMSHRPTLSALDVPLMMWRALRMPRTQPTPLATSEAAR